MDFTYFASFDYVDDEGGLNGRGSSNDEICVLEKITTMQQIKTIQRELEIKHGLDGVTITFYDLLGESGG